MTNTLIGCDPEFFLKHEGTYRSAKRYILGNKHNPYPLYRGACQVDGTAAEFNIDPCNHVDDFCHNIHVVLKQMKDMTGPDVEFCFESFVEFDPMYFQMLGEDEKILGCDPDFNAFDNGNIHEVFVSPNYPGRTAGGHVHISFNEQDDLDTEDDNHFQRCSKVTKLFDWFTKNIRNLDTDTRRVDIYGAPGMFRPKRYGVECRHLSNTWVRYQALWPCVFEAGQEAFKASELGIDKPNHTIAIPKHYKESVWNG